MTPLLVIIPTHGRPKLLERTLRSVAMCSRPEGYLGIVAVENGPRAGAEGVIRAVAREHPEAKLRYHHHSRPNKSAALNAALAGLAPGTLCVFLDDDVRVEAGILALYSAVAQKTGRGAFMGGSTRCDYDETPPDWLLPLLPLSARGLDLGGADADALYLGFNWAAFAGDIMGAGGFDPNYGPGAPTNATGQESNMQGRLLLLGCRMVNVPGAVVYHHVPAERCSPSWAVGRKYRDAIGWGRVDRVRQSFVSFVPRHAWLMTRCALIGLKKAAVRDQFGFWRAAKQAGHHAGHLRGYVQVKRPVDVRTATVQKPGSGDAARLFADEILRSVSPSGPAPRR